MRVEITPWASEVLRRSVEAARRFNENANIRLSVIDGLLHSALADAPEPADEQIELGAVTVFVEGTVDGLIDVAAPHDRLVLRPHGATPNERP